MRNFSANISFRIWPEGRVYSTLSSTYDATVIQGKTTTDDNSVDVFVITTGC